MATTTATPCTKKYFGSEQDAVSFEKSNRVKNGFQEQFAYKCENCSGWHLSSVQQSKQSDVSQVNYSRMGVAIPQRRTRRSEAEREALRAEILRLRGNGLAPKEIAAKLGEEMSNVYFYLRDPAAKHTSHAPIVDLDSIQSEEEKLEAQLNALRSKKQQFIELKKLKVNWYTNNGSVTPGKVIEVRKEGERMVMTVETATELIEKLTDLLTAGVMVRP